MISLDDVMKRDISIQECFHAIQHVEMLIKGNKEVLDIVKLFPSEKELANSMRKTITGQRKLLRNLKKLTKTEWDKRYGKEAK